VALVKRPRRKVRLGGPRLPWRAMPGVLRAPVLAALLGGAAVLIVTRAGGGGAQAASDQATPHLVSVTLDPRDWPPGQPPTFRRLLGYYGLESTLLSATLAANMRGDQCPGPNAPLASGSTVLLALSRDGPNACDEIASAPAAGN
jgi:hypothetical protein